MTTEPNRVDAGVPTGGQFATKIKSDNVPSLGAPVRRPELEGWPENLPEPEVSFSLGDDSGITTSVNINGEPAFEVWNPGEDVHSIETSCYEMGWSEPDADAAEAWAKKKHEQIASALRAEVYAAVERARPRALAAATGVTPQLTNEQLDDLVVLNGAAIQQAGRDIELASTALAARQILEAFPTAATAEIQVATWDDGEFVNGAVIRDATGLGLREYAEGEEADDEAAAEIIGLLKNLDSEASTAHWADAFSVGSRGAEAFTIDLQKASRWTPGGTA